MEPGSDPFKFMMEVDRLAADLYRLGDKSVTKLRKCVIIVSGLCVDFEMECRILEDNPAGLNRAEIERVVGNQYIDFSGSNRTRRHCQHRRVPSRQIAKRREMRIHGNSPKLPHWHGKRATRKVKKYRGKAGRAVDRRA